MIYNKNSNFEWSEKRGSLHLSWNNGNSSLPG